jgi:hypothetical protein
MAISDVDRLRGLIGEKIPDGDNETATQFSNTELEEMLISNGGDIERAAFEGWRHKAAKYADLVNVTEGNASRAMSDLHKHALDMMSAYAKSSSTLTQGRTRIGRIVRRGFV